MMTLTELFSEPSRWCQGHLAEGKSGRSVNLFSKYAVSWCLSGGLTKCYRTIVYTHLCNLERSINDYLQVDTFTAWNDDPERTIEDIQRFAKVIDGWIEEIRAKGEVE